MVPLLQSNFIDGYHVNNNMHMHTCTTTRNGMQPRGPASHFHSILLITGQNGSMQRASFDFVTQPTPSNNINWVDHLHLSTTPNCMAQLNNCLHRRQMQTTHPHTSLIFYRRPRGVCAAIDIWQSTSSIEGEVDNSETHKTCVMTSLE